MATKENFKDDGWAVKEHAQGVQIAWAELRKANITSKVVSNKNLTIVSSMIQAPVLPPISGEVVKYEVTKAITAETVCAGTSKRRGDELIFHTG